MAFTTAMLHPLLRMMVLCFLLRSSDGLVATPGTRSTVENLRPVVPGRVYRCATLDGLSERDAAGLLDGTGLPGGAAEPLAAVIDLRNKDEIAKGEATRTEGSEFFYSSSSSSSGCRFWHVPLLEDVNAFWDEAIERMDPKDRFLATLQTAVQGGALDRAAARNLEKGGHAMLNTVLLESGKRRIAEALAVCLEESRRGAVVFHCQKGKDRTGVLSMLIQGLLEAPREEIVEAYALSGGLLSGEGKNRESERSGLVDWKHFRGSPASGMEGTLDWIEQRYGSVPAYLEAACSLDASEQARFRDEWCPR